MQGYLNRKFSFVRLILIISVVTVSSNAVYTQIAEVADSAYIQQVDSLRSEREKAVQRSASNNFYKTDSIFSFRSAKGYFPSLLSNLGEQAIAPLHINTRQWLITAGAIGITATLLHFDGDIDERARVQKQKHNWVKQSSPVISDFGSTTGICSAVSFGLISAVLKNEKGVQTSLLATQAMLTSGVWVHLIKILTGRERPEASYNYSRTDAGRWYGPFAQYDQDLAVKRHGSSFDSFPSGHTATAFSIATVFATQYKDKKVVPIASYSLATLVGLSRLTEHKHWASDVFGGAMLGYLCGKQVVRHFNKLHQNDIIPVPSASVIKPELTVFQNGDQIGLSYKW